MSNSRTQLPVILLTFANDVDAHLSLLKREAELLRDIFWNNGDGQDFQLVREETASIQDIFTVVKRFRQHISIFHYGGHASGASLQLESNIDTQTAHVSGLAQILGMMPSLQIVFLNGCATVGQVEILLEQGVKVVIATSTAINDSKALEFSREFYGSLTKNETIENAFKIAKAYMNTTYNKVQIHQRKGLKLKRTAKNDFPWGIYFNDEAVLNWRLKELQKQTNNHILSVSHTGISVHQKEQYLRYFYILPQKEYEFSFLLELFNINAKDKEIFRNILNELIAEERLTEFNHKYNLTPHQRRSTFFQEAPSSENCKKLIRSIIQLIYIDDVEDNSLEKFQYLEYALSIARCIQEATPIIAELYHDIAILQQHMGSYYEAAKYFEKAVQIAKECQLEFEQIFYQSSLASHYTSIMKYDEAKKMLVGLAKIDLTKYKNEHLSVSKIQSNIAALHGTLGDNKKAIEVLETSIQADKNHFGTHHGIVAAKEMKLARMYCHAGKTLEAVRLAERSMDFFRNKFGLYDDRVIGHLHSLALVYNLSGRSMEGEPILNNVYQSYLNKLGNNHPSTIQCQTEIAIKYLEKGGNPQAVQLLEHSLKYYLQHFGENHPNVANCRICLAMIYLQQGSKNAIQLAEQGVQSDLQNFGAEHPEIAWKYNVLGMCYLMIRDVKKAEDACLKSLKLTTKHFGEQSTNTGQVLYTLAQTYFYTNQFQKAKDTLLRYDNIMRHQIGQNYPFLQNVQQMVQQAEFEILKQQGGQWMNNIFGN